jgi:hypothetical protein
LQIRKHDIKSKIWDLEKLVSTAQKLGLTFWTKIQKIRFPTEKNPQRSHFYNDTIEIAKAGYFPNDPILTFSCQSPTLYAQAQ